jgi:hypothetical protein
VDPNHQQQKPPDTENSETQQGGHTHHIPKDPSATIGERQITLARETENTPTRAKESAGESVEPNTTDTPQGDNPDDGNRGASSLTAIEEEKNVHAAVEFWAVMRTTHCLQTRAASANEVTPKTEPGTTSRQQAEPFLENQRNPKRKRGSDYEYAFDTPLASTPKFGIQVGTDAYVLRTEPGTLSIPPTGAGKSKKNVQSPV